MKTKMSAAQNKKERKEIKRKKRKERTENKKKTINVEWIT